jgi:hypothetical protein
MRAVVLATYASCVPPTGNQKSGDLALAGTTLAGVPQVSSRRRVSPTVRLMLIINY